MLLECDFAECAEREECAARDECVERDERDLDDFLSPVSSSLGNALSFASTWDIFLLVLKIEASTVPISFASLSLYPSESLLL